MLTPAHLPELWRLLASLVDAYEATNAEAGIALRTGDEGAFTSASMRLDRAARSLVAFTRAVQSAPPAPVDGEIERLVDHFGDAAVLLDSNKAMRVRRALLLAHVASLLATRDERIAALEAGLREAAGDFDDHARWWLNVDDHAKSDDAARSADRLRALADAPAVDCTGPEIAHRER